MCDRVSSPQSTKPDEISYVKTTIGDVGLLTFAGEGKGMGLASMWIKRS